MRKNPYLSISIPTFNRAEALDSSLAHHVPIAEAYGIEILISDNASVDSTAMVVERWKGKYPFISYYRNEKNLGFDGNFELALTRAQTDYVWLLGDSYLIPMDGIDEILRKISESMDFDIYVFNLEGKIKCKNDLYTDHNKVLVELSGVMSCISCNVLSRNVISGGLYSKYRGTNFLHTGVILDYISQAPFRLNWNKEISISSSRKVLSSSHWTHTSKALQIGVEGWVNLIFSLPIEYFLNSKLKAAKEFGIVSGMLSWRGFLAMRANGAVSVELISMYRQALRMASAGKLNYLLFHLIVLVPIKEAKMAIRCLRAIKRFFN